MDNSSGHERIENALFSSYAPRRTGLMNEERCLSYLRDKYPLVTWRHDSRYTKSVYDITSSICNIDVVGVDKHFRLITDHKDLREHRKQSRAGYIAFQYPRLNEWWFLPVTSTILNKKRPVIDGYMLSHCIDLITLDRVKMEHCSDVMRITPPTHTPPNTPPSLPIEIDAKTYDNAQILHNIANRFSKYAQFAKIDLVITIKHAPK